MLWVGERKAMCCACMLAADGGNIGSLEDEREGEGGAALHEPTCNILCSRRRCPSAGHRPPGAVWGHRPPGAVWGRKGKGSMLFHSCPWSDSAPPLLLLCFCKIRMVELPLGPPLGPSSTVARFGSCLHSGLGGITLCYTRIKHTTYPYNPSQIVMLSAPSCSRRTSHAIASITHMN